MNAFYWYHVIKGDLMTAIGFRRFKSVGKNVLLFKPFYSDRNARCIEIGDRVTIGRFTRMNCYPKRDAQKSNHPSIIIGDDCVIGQRNSFLAGGSIKIGKQVLMASDILITSENHSIDPESDLCYSDQPIECADVEIQDGCWIGEKVCIMPGVTIGRKSIIGAGSIVTKSIPDYCIAVGNPASVIKKYDFDLHAWRKVK